MLASPDGEREVPLADYFTGYRADRPAPGELIRAVADPAAARAAHGVPQDRQAARSTTSPAWRSASPSTCDDGVVAQGPHRARRRRRHPDPGARHRGRARGPAVDAGDRRAPPPRCCGGEGTPMDDHRASAGYRAAMLGTAPAQAARRAPRPPQEVTGMSAPVRAPGQPVVGEAIPHESAALHVTGAALYTDDLVGRTNGRPARLPGAGAARPRARSPRCDTDAGATPCPAWSGCSPPPTCPGVNDAGVKHDEPLFPDRGHVLRPRGLLGARRDPRGRPARRRRRRGRLRAAARRWSPSREAIAAESFQGAPAARWSAATSRPGSPAPPTCSAASSSSPGRSTSTSRRTARSRYVDEDGQVFVQ